MTREELEKIQGLEKKISGLSECLHLIDEKDTWIEIRHRQHQGPIIRTFPDQDDFKSAIRKVFESKIETAKKSIDEIERNSTVKPSIVYMDVQVREDGTQSNLDLKDESKQYIPRSSFWILTISVSILWVIVGYLFICTIK